MSYITLSDEHWTRIRDFLVGEPAVYLGDEAECRRFVSAALWICRTGAPWRSLPSEWGKWNSVYKRFTDWSKKGVWQRMMEVFADDSDMENGMIDSTIIRAHPCAAGAKKKTKTGIGAQSWRV